MKAPINILLLLAFALLAGCAGHVSPQMRPYTAEESRQLALESLNRRGLTFEAYQVKKAELLGQAPKSSSFDNHGEMNAERSVQLHGRPS